MVTKVEPEEGVVVVGGGGPLGFAFVAAAAIVIGFVMSAGRSFQPSVLGRPARMRASSILISSMARRQMRAFTK